MANRENCFVSLRIMLLASVVGQVMSLECISFGENYGASSDEQHVRVEGGGSQVDLVMDHDSTAAFRSRGNYLFGSFGMGIKLAPGNSAGTVTAFYLMSDGDEHDEMDFEFLGNTSGQPYILQTNVFAKGRGDREQRMMLWFDPTADYHAYSLIWNQNIIVFYVDAVPVRVFKNNAALGVPFPNDQAVGIHASLWDGSTWATQGGKVPLDWNAAPFVASFQGFEVDACQVYDSSADAETATICSSPGLGLGRWWDAQPYHDLRTNQIRQLRDIHGKYVVYDYCTDASRFPSGPPLECAINWYEE